MFLKKIIIWLVSSGLGLSGATAASVTPRNPIETADGAFLLTAESALLLKNGSKAGSPVLVPRLDAFGFPATQVIGPVAPTDGGLSWTIEVPVAGDYLASLEFAHAQEGNAFELSAGGQVLFGFAPDTRGSFAVMEVGKLILAAGRQTLALRNLPAKAKGFMSIAAIYLRPAARKTMTRPEIRAAIAQFQPRQLPTALQLPDLFSDHMVLQRRMPVPVWGQSAPGTTITVHMGQQTKKMKTNDLGRWRVSLDPMEAGGPYQMKVEGGRESVELTDVLVGEVWFGSGQSNMEVSVKPLPGSATTEHPYDCDEDTRQLLEGGVDPQIRISAVTRDHLKAPHWVLLSQENCLVAPALMTSVAVLLRKELNVPVGIIIRCESSSASGIWLSRDAVEGDGAIQRQIQDYAAQQYPKLAAAYPEQVREWEALAVKAKAAGTKLPIQPAAPPLPGGTSVNRGFDGNIFFSEGRFEHYGATYQARIEPVIPYAIRGIVWDQGENGTGIAGADQTTVMPALVRSWRQAWDRDDLPFLYVRKNQHPANLPAVMAALTHTAEVDNRGLGQINHPPDKAAYARRVVEQMKLHVYTESNSASPSLNDSAKRSLN